MSRLLSAGSRNPATALRKLSDNEIIERGIEGSFSIQEIAELLPPLRNGRERSYRQRLEIVNKVAKTFS